ncbi:MAG: hypothetical protein KatS3mg008_0505 [Acidimicrobiales bacterium]|nr:MAG: hypothetical protein KatS3mg008_0505 [Acidimicrobiales bacterium]
MWAHLRAAAEEATLLGVATDLAERSDDIWLATRCGLRASGRVERVGRDFVTLLGRERLLVPEWAICAIGTIGQPGPTGDRQVCSSLDLRMALAELAEEGTFARIRLCSGASVDGVIASVGEDIARIERVQEQEHLHQTIFVPLRALTTVVLGPMAPPAAGL